MNQVSKLDQAGCFVEYLGKSIQKLDDNFGDENGDVKIKGLNNILKLAGFAYNEIQISYKDCLGKEFTIELGNDALEAILKTLLELLPSQVNSNEPLNSNEPSVRGGKSKIQN